MKWKKVLVLFIFLITWFNFLLAQQPTVKGFKSLFVNNVFDTNRAYQSQLNPKAIPFVQDYIKKQGKELERMKGWGKSYFKLYDGILKKYKIPVEMKYLSVIESHLQSNLVSCAGAVGPWQLMDYEAKRFGLRVGMTDDRMDYVKSTHVACKLMKELYKEFGDWLLVVAAYNGGAGRVRGAIKKSGSRDFWDLQNFLLDETKNHVKKFIATHYLFEGNGNINNTHYYNENKIDTTGYNSIDSIVVSGRYNAAVVCKYLQIQEIEFNNFNPNFNKQLSAGNKYVMKIAKKNVPIFYSNKYQILQESFKKLLNN